VEEDFCGQPRKEGNLRTPHRMGSPDGLQNLLLWTCLSLLQLSD